MTNIFDEGAIETLNAELVAAQERIKVRANEILAPAVKKIFELIPDLCLINWTQYTPYFADGDECVFGVGEINFLSQRDVDVGEDEDYRNSYYLPDNKYFVEQNKQIKLAYGDNAEKYRDITKQFVTFINLIPEDTMKSLFGDHVKVTIRKDKIEIDEYEHE